ncbi:SusE domain-containing protein [Lutibacter sp.]|uniref:SusE domain-containing protein n=1 Tax=Lutibacter sp. TaxID=1925666 RepID=UPI003567FDC0
MKNILKYLLLSLFFVSITSCDNEDQDQLVITPSGSGEITAPATGAKYILNPEEESTNPAFTLTWNAADYGIPTEINYIVQFAAAGTDFAEPYLAGSTTNLNLTWTIQEFNGACVTAGLSPFVEGELEIRVISTVGSNAVEQQISETITVIVTPFTTDLPKIAVPGNHQGWDPASAPTLAASGFGETDYEGYVWLDGEYKFVAPDATGGFFWGNTDWGDDGTFTGNLVADDEVNCNATTTGFYFVTANTTTLKYTTKAMSWGIIGGSIPNTGWNSDIDMTYNPETRTHTITLDFVNPSSDGGFKFRPNNDWAGNLGDNDADGSLETDGANIEVPENGNYTVTLDLSNPREYTYSLVKN